MKETRKANVIFNKNGNGFLTTKITIPVPFIKELGFTEEDKEAIITIDGEKIIIEKGGINMRKLTVKEINNLTIEKLEATMSDNQKERMFKLLEKNAESNKYSTFLSLLQDSANSSGQEEDEEHVTIDEYLDYLEDMWS